MSTKADNVAALREAFLVLANEKGDVLDQADYKIRTRSEHALNWHSVTTLTPTLSAAWRDGLRQNGRTHELVNIARS